MADEEPSGGKARSASICAPGLSSMEQVLTESAGKTGTPPPDSSRRRRPAARSQSARLTGGRSVRRRHPPAHTELGGSNHSIRSGSSEPRLSEVSTGAVNESPSPGGFRRKGSTQRRVNSVYQRKSTAFLDVPSDVKHGHSLEAEDEDSYRLRSFSFTSKGVVNRGDSFRRRRSRSNSLLPPSPCPEPPSTLSPVPSPEVVSYRVAMLGAPGVGKTALVSQFMTSECINAYERTRDDVGPDGVCDQSVCIMLNGEESELKFINIGNEKGEVDKSSSPADAYVVMYSVIDKASFQRAEDELSRLQDFDMLRARPAILVANKVDLARSRAVSAQDGKCLACTYRAKFIEVSVGINHNVDELLVGILTQIRMKRATAERESGSHWYKNRGVVRASMKARQMFTWIFGKEDSKFKNCENLHVL